MKLKLTNGEVIDIKFWSFFKIFSIAYTVLFAMYVGFIFLLVFILMLFTI